METPMYRTLLLAPVLFATAANATDGAVGKAQATVPVAAVAFRISSRGRPIDGWEVRADGSASHVTRVSDEGEPFTSYRLEHREFTVSAEDYARLVALAGELPRPWPTRDACEELATDMPYGALELERGGASELIPFDVGCRDAPYQAFVGQLRAIDELVTGWARPNAPARIEQVGGS
jgi:hypothetical protein